MERLVALLKSKHLTIASCESLTAGLFSASIAAIPGASSVLQGALVTYQNQIKEEIAHVDKSLIDKYGVISAECAQAMAIQTKELMHSDICVSFTGNAGPSAMEGKKAGLVYCCIAGNKGLKTYEFQLSCERNELRKEVVKLMAEKLISYIE